MNLIPPPRFAGEATRSQGSVFLSLTMWPSGRSFLWASVSPPGKWAEWTRSSLKSTNIQAFTARTGGRGLSSKKNLSRSLPAKNQLTHLKGEMLSASGRHPSTPSERGCRGAVPFPLLRLPRLQHATSLFLYLEAFSHKMCRRPGTTPGCVPDRNECSCAPKAKSRNVHGCFICNSPKLEKKKEREVHQQKNRNINYGISTQWNSIQQ